MSEERSTGTSADQETNGLAILQRIEDLIVYGLPLLEKWSVPHQKLLGDDMAHCMNRMLELASALTVAYYKKTIISDLDEKNKAFQGYIRVAFKLKYLKGISSKGEFERRSAEIGSMIGSYKKWVYGENASQSKSDTRKSGR